MNISLIQFNYILKSLQLYEHNDGLHIPLAFEAQSSETSRAAKHSIWGTTLSFLFNPWFIFIIKIWIIKLRFNWVIYFIIIRNWNIKQLNVTIRLRLRIHRKTTYLIAVTHIVKHKENSTCLLRISWRVENLPLLLTIFRHIWLHNRLLWQKEGMNLNQN